RFRLLAAVAAEIAVQQVHHRPEMAPFFHVHLIDVAQVVQRRAGHAEHALLFDGGRFGVTLCDDDAAERRSILARYVLPGRTSLVRSEVDLASRDRWREEDAPSIVRHL